MYYVMRASAPSLHRESVDNLGNTSYLKLKGKHVYVYKCIGLCLSVY